MTVSRPPAENTRSDGRDGSLVSRLDVLYVAVISDCLDQVGVRNNVMAPRIRPLTQQCRVSGYAATVHIEPVDAPPLDRDDWYRGEIEALEGMQPGDVMVGSTCTGSYWGELLAVACCQRGVRGVVADAYTRDTSALIGMNFPTFTAGIHAQDSLGRVDVTAHSVPVDSGDVRVVPGDMIIGDQDGVAVIPADVAEEVISKAEEKMAVEKRMKASLRNGMPLSEAFSTYGIL